jgi:hypothetical protein
MVTDPQCANCTIVNQYTQLWCVLRQEGTDCSGWYPLLDNFEYERTITILDCGASGLRIHCGGWISSGCCNNSGSEPSCSGGGTVGGCEGALPPL